MSLVAYTRDAKTRGLKQPYAEKFHSLRVAIEAARAKSTGIVIAAPWVIGDTYEEITESLSRFAEAGVALHVAEP